MNCKTFESLWMARTEGLLRPDEMEAFDRHLGACEPCAWLAREMERLEVELEGLSDEVHEAPPYLKTRVLARLEDHRPRRGLLHFFRRRWITSRRLLAVSTACLAFFAGLLVQQLHEVTAWMRQASTVQPVVLEFHAPDADDVRLVGDFNGWGRQGELVRTERVDGRWVFRLQLDPGRYQYAYLVDGKRWLPDPGAPGIIPDGFGGMNSVLYVQGANAGAGRSL